MSAPYSVTYTLHCMHCGHSLDESADEPMQLVAMFKPSLLPMLIPKTHPLEQRRRCRSCGYVNVFHPVGLTHNWRAVTLKSVI